MSTMQTEVFEALRAIDIPEDKALKAAAALSRREEDVAALRSDVAAVGGDVALLKPDVAALKRDMAVLRWMVGTLHPLVLAILVKLLLP